MKKLFLVLVLAMGVGFMANAACLATSQTITINGQAVEAVVTELTFDGDNVVLHFSDGTSQSADLDAVTIAFGTPASIGEIHTFQLSGITNGQLNVAGLQPGQTVQLFDTSGRLLFSSKSSSDSMTIDMQGMKGGVYILRAGTSIIKFVKR